MKLILNVDYKAAEGEKLFVNYSFATAKGDAVASKIGMTLNGDSRWTAEISCSADVQTVDYYYSVENNGNIIRHEWLVEPHRIIRNSKKTECITAFDHWIDLPDDSYLYSSAFTECVSRRTDVKVVKPVDSARTVVLKVRAPQLRGFERLGLCGAQKELGSWDITRCVEMTEQAPNEWMAVIDASELSGGTLEFKFAALDEDIDETPLWEAGENRRVYLTDIADGETVEYELSRPFFQQIFNLKCAGTLVPVFSLRSRDSFGVGDFGDLKKMIDWVALTEQKVLQVLPINDTTITHTWTDSYPYSCISIFALHPQYADLNALPPLKDKAEAERFENLRQQLNSLPQIDYEAVNNAKNDYLKLIYQQEGKEMMATKEFKTFFEESRHWLVPYAQYCSLRDKYGTADFSKWKDHHLFDEADRKTLENKRLAAYRDVAYYYFLQFVLDKQMRDAHQYAREKNVVLKGDIPIGVNRYGCDVWMEPRYFNLNGQAGAPPDDFSVNGQNWGFPTYNWDEMLKDDCAWWVRRFSNMARYFDAYRIDHVLGFFRIWEIPVESVHGLLGQFSPSLPLTEEEIADYGLEFDADRFTAPLITDELIALRFEEKADEVKKIYLQKVSEDQYRMLPQYDTQRKIEAVFKDRTSAEDIKLKEGLYTLVSDVLFVRDHKNPQLFHPRISAQLDYFYTTLSDDDKQAFNNLYNDYFYKRNSQFWYKEAMKKLPKLVEATRMLVCAEDLGMVPECVPWVMDQLKILSLEIQSMPKDSSSRFGHLSRNPYRSVSTISTHDMPTLRQWWDEDLQRTQEYYNTMLLRDNEAPHPLPGWLAKDIIYRHLASPSMLCILSIQDWLAIDEQLRLPDKDAERINVPANPRHYWRYRMHICIEDLIANEDFNRQISELVAHTARAQYPLR